MEEMDFQL